VVVDVFWSQSLSKVSFRRKRKKERKNSSLFLSEKKNSSLSFTSFFVCLHPQSPKLEERVGVSLSKKYLNQKVGIKGTMGLFKERVKRQLFYFFPLIFFTSFSSSIYFISKSSHTKRGVDPNTLPS